MFWYPRVACFIDYKTFYPFYDILTFGPWLLWHFKLFLKNLDSFIDVRFFSRRGHSCYYVIISRDVWRVQKTNKLALKVVGTGLENFEVAGIWLWGNQFLWELIFAMKFFWHFVGMNFMWLCFSPRPSPLKCTSLEPAFIVFLFIWHIFVNFYSLSAICSVYL